MKILFICLSNINRSQIAEALAARLVTGSTVSSAGVRVDPIREGKLVSQIDQLPIRLMRELGYDLSNSRIKQVTPSMVVWADRIISLTKLDELPQFVRDSDKLTLWEIPDPGGLGEAVLRKTIQIIQTNIEQ